MPLVIRVHSKAFAKVKEWERIFLKICPVPRPNADAVQLLICRRFIRHRLRRVLSLACHFCLVRELADGAFSYAANTVLLTGN
jgi:hypothetical protein